MTKIVQSKFITWQIESLFFIDCCRRITQKYKEDITIYLSLLCMFIKISEDFFATIDNVLDARTENVLRSQQNANSSSRYIGKDIQR